MILPRARLVLLACWVCTAVAAEDRYPYRELPPQQNERLPYAVIPVDRVRGFGDDPATDIQARARNEIEIQAGSGEETRRQEGYVAEIAVDRIGDLNPDPKNLYRQMETGDFDDEPMVEIPPRTLARMQLPEPTVIPAAEPSALPVNTIPAQRIVTLPAQGEELIYQQLNPQVRPGQGATLRPGALAPGRSTRQRRVLGTAPVTPAAEAAAQTATP